MLKCFFSAMASSSMQPSCCSNNLLSYPTTDISLNNINKQHHQQQQETRTYEVIHGNIQGSGNFVIRRKNDTIERSSPITPPLSYDSTPLPLMTNIETTTNRNSTFMMDNKNSDIIITTNTTTMDWRRRQIMEKSINTSLSSSSSIHLETFNERDHARGIRKQGCPCCDPDNISNIVDQMLSM